MAVSARHETRALLRAHLSAAAGYRHSTGHCPVCHRLLRLALEQPETAHDAAPDDTADVTPDTAPEPANS
ncbi:hypothetical protein OK074_6748 [Actinobacteria bacterium OK074]|nr:hypothetical protein OK074_6748 [Actinobacteria bacterium OK074]